MCNCGKKRTEMKQQPNVSKATVVNKISVGALQQPLQKKATALFEYIGKTGLTVTGNVTRKNYRFNFSGDVQPIDFNDATAMSAVPVLKRLT